MEEPKNENEVTLVLRGSRITTRKDMLARNSLYFAALFSANFKDHLQNEFDINYDISLVTLQTFVDWANDEGKDARVVHSSKYHFDVRVSLEKFLTGNHSELLELLNVSVVFAAAKLTDDITEIIVRTRLHPDVMSEVWLLAEELELKVLRDIAFASCLDRFEDFSLSCLLKLSKDYFFSLVLNRNVNSSSDHMTSVIEEWKKNNGVINSFVGNPVELDQQDNIEPGQNKADRWNPLIDLFYYYFEHEGNTKIPTDPDEILTSNVNAVKILYEAITPCYMACGAGRGSDNTLSVWAWNKVTREIEEITKMTNSQMLTTLVDNGKEIVGRQVIGRAFSIYLIGGELGLGTGRFNTTLWRYCLFSKKWYIETVLPQPRRHMAVAFLKNKLYLFGGVGRHRLKLSSVDVYDIHAGTWSQAADILETFTEVPASCVAGGKFYYNKSLTYVYDPTSNAWKTWRSDEIEKFPIRSMIASMFRIQSMPGGGPYNERRLLRLYSGIKWDALKSNPLIGLELIPFTRDETEEPAVFDIAWNLPDRPDTIYQEIWNDPWLVSFGATESESYVTAQHFVASGDRASDTPGELKLTIVGPSHRTFDENLTNVPADCFKYRLGCFNIIDPRTLDQSIDGYLLQLCRGSQ